MANSLSIQSLLPVKAALLMILLAVMAYTQVYLPALRRHRELQKRETTLQTEIEQIELYLAQMEERRAALEAGERGVVEEAIRRELGWGHPGEYLLVDEPK